MQAFEKFFEAFLFKSRWLLAPLYLGLVLSLLLLVVKFGHKFVLILGHGLSASGTELIVDVLGLVDIVLIGNLLLIIIFSGYESFVSKIAMIQDHVDKPDWMGKVSYTDIKLKVIGSVVAISTIELLRAFMNVHNSDKTDLLWMVILHLSFVISGVLFALMGKLGRAKHE